MANRRCLHTLTRHYYSSLLSSSPSLKSLPKIHQTLTLTLPNPSLSPQTPNFHHISTNLIPNHHSQHSLNRHFCSHQSDDDDDDDEVDDDDDDEVDDDEAEYSDGESVLASNRGSKKAYTPEEREKEAAGIGYKVVGPLDRADRVFKPYEPAFAVVQIGSHQFKVSNGDCIFTERLKFCEVNDKLILNKVLMVGSKTQTIIGRPILPDAAVIAVVEEHALDAKVIIFKKKRRKNYRRTKGHRQELTKLRITDIQGVEKQEETTAGKTKKANVKEPEKVAVAA